MKEIKADLERVKPITLVIPEELSWERQQDMRIDLGLMFPRAEYILLIKPILLAFGRARLRMSNALAGYQDYCEEVKE